MIVKCAICKSPHEPVEKRRIVAGELKDQYMCKSCSHNQMEYDDYIEHEYFHFEHDAEWYAPDYDYSDFDPNDYEYQQAMAEFAD